MTLEKKSNKLLLYFHTSPVYPKHAKTREKHMLLSLCRAIKAELLKLWEDTVTEQIYIETRKFPTKLNQLQQVLHFSSASFKVSSVTIGNFSHIKW